MTRSYAPSGLDTPASAFEVERPRATDAIASALRDVYSRDTALPEDMIAILARLNGGRFHNGR